MSNDPAASRSVPTPVKLVGAGPGDPGLITVAGADFLRRCDCVVHDRLANPELLELAPDTAERVYVGKTPGQKSTSQDEINALLIEKCRAGKDVVRLKGGDPLLFGRGGEEATALRRAGLPFRIVPGITAALAAAAYAGLPLTDRRLAGTLAILPGHVDPKHPERAERNIQAVAQCDTIVLYMGVGNLTETVRSLIQAGKDADTPAAIVENATHPTQRTVIGTLTELPELAERADVHPPALIVISPAVQLRRQIGWYEDLPLFGKTLLVTRTRTQASELSVRLRELGASVIEAPAIEITAPEDLSEVDATLADAGRYDWLILTSPNGVRAMGQRLDSLQLDARSLAGVRIAAIGPATARALAERGLRPDLIPKTHTTAALAEALVEQMGPRPSRLVLMRSDLATAALPNALRDAGHHVTDLTLYQTSRPAGLPEEASVALQRREVDWVTFTSSSTVENFVALMGGDLGLFKPVKLAAIGPVTAGALGRHGLSPTVTAEVHTIPGLVRAIAEYEDAE
ncbi:MAG: uroporphyrinogen-III C-methyltransferase [Phycisphaerae bacterium]